MNAKKSFKYARMSIFFIGLLCFVQCEKVIDLELKTVTPQIVIEGNISNAKTRHTVKITKTADFYDESAFHPVRMATVIISDNVANIDTLEETSDGIYQTSIFAGVEGRSYTLTVQSENEEYIATSTMPLPISIDTIFMTETTRWGETARSVRVQFKDLKGVTNYYRFSLIRNDKPFSAKFILDDRLYDGQDMNYDLIQLSEDPLESGDFVQVYLYGIDSYVYNYFATLPSNWEPPAVPANPISNINNGALGYFSAQSESTKSLIVQ